MKIILFGGSGMVGQGVLRECLLSAEVSEVLLVVRSASGRAHKKLREIVLANINDIVSVAEKLRGYDACFYCLGTTSSGLTEKQYSEITYDLTMLIANLLVGMNPGMTFVFISGLGTDSSEQGRVMWARVKGRTENALLRLPFKAAYMLRPGVIQPLHGIKSKTWQYQILYTLMTPALPLLKRLMPGQVTTTEQIGRAMIKLAVSGEQKPVLETRDINEL